MKTITRSPEETEALAGDLAATLAAGDLVLLAGELGAGKTEFVKGLAKGLGIHGIIQSPTFALVREHRDGRVPLIHLDLYRLAGGGEVEELGLDELRAEGIVAVEWPERAAASWTKPLVRVALAYGAVPDERLIEWQVER
ncbi:MAG TPA: tRNA (adenosine(37)-N6)-threonylcarbamoyltransferase complex ATPase subunit type 1 TsaE [bacterium]|nr:tRNA (adenosine(37)-N6)-threonylcarbamoyltransferase complex ATPase subunit type 1 TsaE [bacterium]